MADLLMMGYIHYKVYENTGLKKAYENTEVMPHNPQVNIVIVDQFHLLITLHYRKPRHIPQL
jgi:hypothetical protein